MESKLEGLKERLWNVLSILLFSFVPLLSRKPVSFFPRLQMAWWRTRILETANSGLLGKQMRFGARQNYLCHFNKFLIFSVLVSKMSTSQG